MSFDPLTRLSKAELKLLAHINHTYSREQALVQLKTLLQTAVEIELATIPIYLYTYYSINRTVHTGENMTQSDVFANKAGAMIMSVAVEEMLHMSLSSNVLFSLGEMPVLYQKAPAHYPTNLPGHNPKAAGPKGVPHTGPHGSDSALIPLSKLTYEQLWKFLVIEYPENVEADPEDGENGGWDTIGQVYSYVRCLIASDHIHDNDFKAGSRAHQIQDYNYAPNNTDTVHVLEPYDSWKTPSGGGPAGKCPSAAAVAIFDNSDDSHAGKAGAQSETVELISISCKEEAFIAIDTICDQGEGYAQPKDSAGSGGTETEPTDDPLKSELSHYYKFLTLQAQFEEYDQKLESLPPYPVPPPAVIQPSVTVATLAQDGVLFNYPDNPETAHYPAELQDISNFCNGVFQYMLILTETIYKVDPANQKVFFNEGMHRSMIWVLDKLIQSMRKIKIQSGPYSGHVMAPTFENIDLGDRTQSFEALRKLGEKASESAEDLIQYAMSMSPNVDHDYRDTLKSAAQSVQYYVRSSVSVTDPEGHPMHLPDAGPYWTTH